MSTFVVEKPPNDIKLYSHCKCVWAEGLCIEWDGRGRPFQKVSSAPIFQAIMKNLVRRYVTQEQRKAENEGVTEDDVNEIKNDISAFRFEFIDIMRQTGHKVESITGLHGEQFNREQPTRWGRV